ncbi:MAG: S16 family serine protease [archaeon]
MDKRIIALFIALIFISCNAFAILQSGEIRVFAVTEDEVGMAADLFLTTMAGTGKVAFITSSSLVGKDTQTTGNIALDIAQEKTGVDISKKNFIFDIQANASEVDGPSAGAAMTLLMYSVLEERPLPKEVGITGTINSDGSVGVVGGVFAKAKVASEVGIKLLMIPRGEANQVYNDNGKATSVNLLKYGPEELGMKIVEVDTIDDVLKYAYSDINSIVVDVTNVQNGFVPPAIQYKPILTPMREFSKSYIDEARSSVEDAKKELEVTTLEDPLRSSFYPRLGAAERNIELANIFLDQNYLYSSANYTFNAQVLADSIGEIAKTPSLMSPDSSILALKLSELESTIKELKGEMSFIPVDKVEWMIGAQQRIAYAENAIASARKSLDLPAEATTEEIQSAMFDKVYDYVSASAWVGVAKDFFGEAKKAQVKKNTYYSPEFIMKVEKKLSDVEKLVMTSAEDSNTTQDVLTEATRRFNSAQISFDNNFFFAAYYDAYFAESFIFAEKRRSNMDANKLAAFIESRIGDSGSLTSLWAALYLDHAHFFLENSKYEESLNKQLERSANLTTGYDLAVLSENLENVKADVDEYLAFTEMTDFVSNEPVVDITYKRIDNFSPFFAIIVISLCAVLLILIIIGLRMRTPDVSPRDYARADKLYSVLGNLDKALSKKKITDAEYFFMKKKYDSEIDSISNHRLARKASVVNLEESTAKLRALEKGLTDIKKHHKSGLMLSEDFEKQSSQVEKEIGDIRGQVSQMKKEVKTLRRSGKPKMRVERIVGTAGLVVKEAMEEKAEKAKRKKLLDIFFKK